MYRLLICCVLTFIQVHAPGQAQTAYLEPRRVFEGDIAELIIEYDSKIPSLYALDTSSLESDFEVLDIKSGVSQVVESGEMFHRMQWKIEILPRHSGSLGIPALQLGDISTPVLTLEVMPQTPGLRSTQNIFVEIQALPQNPYVGQLTRVIVRVLHNIPLPDYKLIDATIENADVYRNGRDSRYVTTRDGEEFNVLERRIALVAEIPGKISLSPASYSGLIKSARDSSDADSTAQSRRINRYSETLQLEIREPPPEFSGEFWLPARQLEISQHWDEISGALNVGDSLGLTLTIESRGLPAKALPAGLIVADSGQFKIYADQEKRSNRYQENDLVGRLEQRFAVVVTQPGEIAIPATMLKWWDVNHDVERVALLEGKKLIVMNPVDAQSAQDELTQLRSKPLSTAGFVLASVRNPWQWVVLISLIFLCGLSFFVKPVRDRVIGTLRAYAATRRNRKALKQACISNDPACTRRELLLWGGGQWPDDNINGLHQIEVRTESGALVRELHRLNAALYANQASTWRGRALWRLIAAEQCYHPGPDAYENPLPDLYPRQDSSVQTVTR